MNNSLNYVYTLNLPVKILYDRVFLTFIRLFIILEYSNYKIAYVYNFQHYSVVN